MKEAARETTPYHHGDLRQTLIVFARQAIEQDGLGKLSMRKLAALAGVSHNAPYMHFKTKDALLDAVAADGYQNLSASIAAAGGRAAFTPDDWRSRVILGLKAYVAFAQDNPALYALMNQPAFENDTHAAAVGQGTLDALARTMQVGQQMGLVRQGDAGDHALWVWSTLHGLAGVTSVNRKAFGTRSPQDVTSQVLVALLDGLAP